MHIAVFSTTWEGKKEHSLTLVSLARELKERCLSSSLLNLRWQTAKVQAKVFYAHHCVFRTSMHACTTEFDSKWKELELNHGLICMDFQGKGACSHLHADISFAILFVYLHMARLYKRAIMIFRWHSITWAALLITDHLFELIQVTMDGHSLLQLPSLFLDTLFNQKRCWPVQCYTMIWSKKLAKWLKTTGK